MYTVTQYTGHLL